MSLTPFLQMAGAMKMSVPDFWRTTPSDFYALFDGWKTSKGVNPGPDLSPNAVAELEDLMERYPDTVH